MTLTSIKLTSVDESHAVALNKVARYSERDRTTDRTELKMASTRTSDRS